jgi:hypothetical protein
MRFHLGRRLLASQLIALEALGRYELKQSGVFIAWHKDCMLPEAVQPGTTMFL